LDIGQIVISYFPRAKVLSIYATLLQFLLKNSLVPFFNLYRKRLKGNRVNPVYYKEKDCILRATYHGDHMTG
jgi:hypothetical protein